MGANIVIKKDNVKTHKTGGWTKCVQKKHGCKIRLPDLLLSDHLEHDSLRQFVGLSYV